MGYRQLRNGGATTIKSRTTLVMPSFADHVTRHLLANIMLPLIDEVSACARNLLQCDQHFACDLRPDDEDRVALR